MKTKEMEMDAELASYLMAAVKCKHLPIQIQDGLPYINECGRPMVHLQIDHADDYDLNAMLCGIINKKFGLT